MFISATFSEYDGEKVIWKADLTQEDVLGFNLNSLDVDEHSLMEEVQEQLVNKPNNVLIRKENPCHYGMTFCGFKRGKYMYLLDHIHLCYSLYKLTIVIWLIYYQCDKNM